MSNLSELLPAGGGQNDFTVTAKGNIANGAVVVINKDGKAYATFTDSAGTPVQITTNTIAGNTASILVSAYDSVNKKVVLVYEDVGNSEYGTVVVGTVSEGTITFGTPVVFISDTIQGPTIAFSKYTGRIVIGFVYQASSYQGWAITGLVSGTSVTFSSSTVFNSANTDFIAITSHYDPVGAQERMLIAYRNNGNSGYGTAKLATFQTAGNLTYGAAVVFNSANSDYITCAFDTVNNKGVVAYSSSGGYARSTSASGDTLTYGSPVQYETGGVNYNSVVFDESSGVFVVAYEDDSFADKGTATVLSPSGTDLSAGTPVVFDGKGGSLYEWATYNSVDKQVMVTYRIGSAAYSVKGTVSGSSITFTNRTEIISTNNFNTGSVYDPDTNQLVVFYRNGGVAGNPATALVSTINNLSEAKFFGLAAQAISDGQTGTVNGMGSINTSQSSLTIGSNYHVYTDGSLVPGIVHGSVSDAVYDNASFSVALQENTPNGIVLNPTGTKMYISGSQGDAVYQYSLSTPFDISTASYDNVSLDCSGQGTNIGGVTVNNDGTKFYVLDFNNDTVFQYALATPYDLSTGSFDSKSFSVGTQDSNPHYVVFNNDGTKMFMVGNTNNTVYQYSLSSAFDVSTASYDSVSLNVGSQDATPTCIAFANNGERMWVMGLVNKSLFQYSLGIGYDLATANYDSLSFSINAQDTNAFAFTFGDNNTKMYVLGRTNDAVFQYSISTAYSDFKIGQAINATTINMKSRA